MAKVGETFVEEFVIGLGFLSGLWIYAGVDPESALLGALVKVVQAFVPNPTLSFLFQIGVLWILPIFATILSIAGAYFMGGGIGLVAVALAFVAGLTLNSIGVWLLLIAFVIGLTAPSLKSDY